MGGQQNGQQRRDLIMPSLSESLLILGMFVVTFGVRYLPLAFSGRMKFPQSLERALRFVPVAVLTALIVPMVLLPDNEWALTPTNPYLIASLVAIGVAAWRRNLMLTIVVGLIVFFLMRITLIGN